MTTLQVYINSKNMDATSHGYDLQSVMLSDFTNGVPAVINYINSNGGNASYTDGVTSLLQQMRDTLNSQVQNLINGGYGSDAAQNSVLNDVIFLEQNGLYQAAAATFALDGMGAISATPAVSVSAPASVVPVPSPSPAQPKIAPYKYCQNNDVFGGNILCEIEKHHGSVMFLGAAIIAAIIVMRFVK